MADFLINNFPSIFTASDLESLEGFSILAFLGSLFLLLPCLLYILAYWDDRSFKGTAKTCLGFLSMILVFAMVHTFSVLYQTVADGGLDKTIRDNYVVKITGKVVKMSNDKKEFVLENGKVVKTNFTDKPVYVDESIEPYYEYVGYVAKKGLTKNQRLSVERFLKLNKKINKSSYSQVRPVMGKWGDK